MMFYVANHVSSQASHGQDAPEPTPTLRTLFNEARAALRQARAGRAGSSLPVQDTAGCA